MTIQAPPRRTRLLSLLLAAVTLLAADRLAGPSRAYAQLASQPPNPVLQNPDHQSGAWWLRMAAELAAQGDYRGADAAYRNAWSFPETRRPAAQALERLHSVPGFTLLVDEAQVSDAARALGRGFKRYQTSHFILLSDGKPEWAMSRAALLERTRREFFRTASRLELDAVPHQFKLLVILFSDQSMYRAFAAASDGLDVPWVAGYYSTRNNRAVFYDDASSPAFREAMLVLAQFDDKVKKQRADARAADRANDDALADRLLASADDLEARIEQERGRIHRLATDAFTAKTIHEAVHLLAFNTGVQLRSRDYPFWLSEGLAVSFETVDPTASFGPARESVGRAECFRSYASTGRLVPARQLVMIRDAQHLHSDDAEPVYCQSYALFAHLYRTQRPRLSEYMRELNSGPAGARTSQEHAALFIKHFGDPDAVMRRVLSRY